MLFHGLADVTVPPESSMEFLKQLRGANVPSELHTFAGVPHEFVGIPEFADATAQLADFFLERHVINPKTYPPLRRGSRWWSRRRGGAGAAGNRSVRIVEPDRSERAHGKKTLTRPPAPSAAVPW